MMVRTSFASEHFVPRRLFESKGGKVGIVLIRKLAKVHLAVVGVLSSLRHLVSESCEDMRKRVRATGRVELG